MGLFSRRCRGSWGPGFVGNIARIHVIRLSKKAATNSNENDDGNGDEDDNCDDDDADEADHGDEYDNGD